MTLATVRVAMFFLVPTLLITYMSFLDIEGSYFVDNPFGQELFYPAVFADWYRELASLIRAYEPGIGSGDPGAGVLPEALLTTLITTLAFLALSRRHLPHAVYTFHTLCNLHQSCLLMLGG